MLQRLQLVALGVLLPRGTEGLRLSTAPRTRCALAATASAAPHKLEAIECAPSTPWLQPSAFELSEGIGGGMVGHGAWCSAMRALCTSETFQISGWAQRPFKLDERWQFAVNSYTMADVARDVTLLPPQFIASGVRVGDGIYNKPMDPGFSAADVEARMETATVVLLNAGFLVPKLARVSLAMLEATRLPIWLNVYLSRPGLPVSTQLHTDKQDVLLVQCSGRKRWRVYSPPPAHEAPHLDPYARGKGTDLMEEREEDLLMDTVLYVPAGFTHTTDTIETGDDVDTSDLDAATSVHMTIGVDTHLWGLSWASFRDTALRRAGHTPNLASGEPINALPNDKLFPDGGLHTPLPLGFASAPLLGDHKASGDVGVAAAQAEVASAMARGLADRLRSTEPERFAADDLDADLGLREAADRMVEHYRAVLGVQTRAYARAAYSDSVGESTANPKALERERQAAQAALADDMEALDGVMTSLDRWTKREAEPSGGRAAGGGMGGAAAGAKGAATAGFGGGMGGGAKSGGKKKAKGGKKKRK